MISFGGYKWSFNAASWVQYHDGAIAGLDCLAARDVAEGKKGRRLPGLCRLGRGRLDRATSWGPHSLLVVTLGLEFLSAEGRGLSGAEGFPVAASVEIAGQGYDPSEGSKSISTSTVDI